LPIYHDLVPALRRTHKVMPVAEHLIPVPPSYVSDNELLLRRTVACPRRTGQDEPLVRWKKDVEAPIGALETRVSFVEATGPPGWEAERERPLALTAASGSQGRLPSLRGRARLLISRRSGAGLHPFRQELDQQQQVPGDVVRVLDGQPHDLGQRPALSVADVDPLAHLAVGVRERRERVGEHLIV